MKGCVGSFIKMVCFYRSLTPMKKSKNNDKWSLSGNVKFKS